jgi:hypothetical protein
LSSIPTPHTPSTTPHHGMLVVQLTGRWLQPRMCCSFAVAHLWCVCLLCALRCLLHSSWVQRAGVPCVSFAVAVFGPDCFDDEYLENIFDSEGGEAFRETDDLIMPRGLNPRTGPCKCWSRGRSGVLLALCAEFCGWVQSLKTTCVALIIEGLGILCGHGFMGPALVCAWQCTQSTSIPHTQTVMVHFLPAFIESPVLVRVCACVSVTSAQVSWSVPARALFGWICRGQWS